MKHLKSCWNFNRRSNTIDNRGDKVTISGGAGNDSVFNDNGANVTISGGAGNDSVFNDNGANVTISGGAAKYNIIQYASGDGKDTIRGFNEDDTLQITSGTYETSVRGKDVIVKVGKGSVRLKKAVGKSITIVDAEGNANTQIYGSSSSSLFAENNFATADNLSSIVENNLTATDYKVETNNFETLAQENLITYQSC